MEKTIAPEILIISSQENPNAISVQKYIKEKNPSIITSIFDLACLPRYAHISVATWNDRFYTSITDCSQNGNTEIISFQKIHTIWWLEPCSPIISEQITDYNQILFAYLGCCKAVESLRFLCDFRWINPPESIVMALNPICQICYAKKAGFSIPNMLLTSSPEDLLSFFENDKKDIWHRNFLPFSVPIKMTEQDMGDLQSLTLSPIIFQKLYGKNIFAIVIIGKDAYPLQLDVGNETNCAWKTCDEIPQEILVKSQKLANIFMFEIAMIQLESNEKKEFVFVSISPWCDFVKLESEVKTPFVEYFAKFLLQLKD